LTFTTKCKGILDPGGTTLTNTSGWSLHLIARTSIDDPSNGDMTIIDSPTDLPLPAIVDGKFKSTLKLGGPCDGILCDPFGPSIAPPPCTQLEVIVLELRDPVGRAFAKLGSSGR
jgi:hypothetical protein